MSTRNDEKDQNIDEQIFSIVKTVVNKCRLEKENNSLLYPLDDYLSRAAVYTACTQEIIKGIDEKWQLIQNSRTLIETHCFVIYKAIRDVIIKNENPEYFNSYEEYTNICENQSLIPLDVSKFKDSLEAMGFAIKIGKDGKRFLIENPKTNFERFYYLKKILKYRNAYNKQVYYVDERIIDNKLNFNKPCTVRKSDTTEKFLFYYMVSVTGYVIGLFSAQESDACFKKWLTEIALPKMKPQSVIIMDKSCYKKLFQESISIYHSKKEMTKWLQQKQIPYASDMIKAELYELIRNTSGTKSNSATYNFIKACGHEVLSLPSTFLELSLADKMWKLLDYNVAPSEISGSQSLFQGWLLTKIKAIHPKDWKKSESQITKLEQDMYIMDAAIETYLEKNYEAQRHEIDQKSCDCNDFNYVISKT